MKGHKKAPAPDKNAGTGAMNNKAAAVPPRLTYRKGTSTQCVHTYAGFDNAVPLRLAY